MAIDRREKREERERRKERREKREERTEKREERREKREERREKREERRKKREKREERRTRAKIKIDTFSKLGFVHRRSVFEPPEPKVDYPYYVFGKTSKKHPPEATLASRGPPGPQKKLTRFLNLHLCTGAVFSSLPSQN